MRIDVWSDLLCPFCHLGRRYLERALQDFEHAEEVSVIWHSFQLDPDAPAEVPESNLERLSAKYGVGEDQMRLTMQELAADAAQVDLDFQWERVVAGNSYDAHRLIHFARFQGKEEPVTHRLMQGWFSEGRSLGDPTTLLELATEAGMDAQEVRGLLDSDAFGHEVRADLSLAGQIGISSVPTFVLDQKFGVTGAQPPEVMLSALRYAWDDQGNPAVPAGGGCGGACGCAGGGGGQTSEESADAAATPEPVAAGGCGSGGCACSA